MNSLTISLCFLSLAAFAALSHGAQYNPSTATTPTVSIQRSNNMSPTMQLDASNFLKKALTMSTTADRCSIFRQLYAEKYPDYKWHVIMYRAYSVQYLKSIDLKAGSDNYLLFATKNKSIDVHIDFCYL